MTLAPQGPRGREVIAKIDIPAHLKEKPNSLVKTKKLYTKIVFFSCLLFKFLKQMPFDDHISVTKIE